MSFIPTRLGFCRADLFGRWSTVSLILVYFPKDHWAVFQPGDNGFLHAALGQPTADQTIQAHAFLGGPYDQGTVYSGGTRTMNFPL